MRSSGRPRWVSTTTRSSGPTLGSGPASRASFTSESTSGESHWATSSGPRSPAASTANRCPSTTRAPTATGSTPRRAHARSRNDNAGTSSTSTRSSATSSSTVRSATTGRAGHAVEHLTGLGGRRHELLDDPGVDLVEGGGLVVDVVEGGRRGERPGGGVTLGAQVAPLVGLDRGERARGEQVRAPGPEAHDHDPRTVGHGAGGSGLSRPRPPSWWRSRRRPAGSAPGWSVPAGPGRPAGW